MAIIGENNDKKQQLKKVVITMNQGKIKWFSFVFPVT